MKKQNWFERLVDKLGGGEKGKQKAAGASKHERGKQRPHGWHRTLRNARKRQKSARRAQRGKR